MVGCDPRSAPRWSPSGSIWGLILDHTPPLRSPGVPWALPQASRRDLSPISRIVARRSGGRFDADDAVACISWSFGGSTVLGPGSASPLRGGGLDGEATLPSWAAGWRLAWALGNVRGSQGEGRSEGRGSAGPLSRCL
jgi:hypothetical protein